MSNLPELARLLREHHRITAEIAALTGRPAERGHLGEFIAAAIFDIALAEGANQRGSDGVFRSGPLAGRSVNIRWYGVNERILDLAPLDPPNYYLVLTGPAASGGSSRGSTRPLTIEHVYLFESQTLLAELAGLGVRSARRQACGSTSGRRPRSTRPPARPWPWPRGSGSSGRCSASHGRRDKPTRVATSSSSRRPSHLGRRTRHAS